MGSARFAGYIQIASTGETLVLPDEVWDRLLGFYQTPYFTETPNQTAGMVYLPDSFSITFGDGSTKSGMDAAKLFNKAEEHQVIARFWTEEHPERGTEILSGPLQNAPDEYLGAQQNSGGEDPSAVTASGGQDSIGGDVGANVIDTAGVASSAFGGGGNDTYVFQAGYGHVSIDNHDAGNNGNQGTIRFGQGIAAIDLSFARTGAGHNDLVITIGGGGDASVTVLGAFVPSGTGRIRDIAFADGSTLSGADLLAVVNTPSSTNTALYGTSGSDTFDGQGVATYAEGRGGNDTYAFYGTLTINNYSFGNDGTRGRLVLDASIASSDVAVSRGGIDGTDLVLKIADTSDAVTIQKAFDPSGHYAIGQVVFADGTTWTTDQIARLIVGMTGDPAQFYLGLPGVDYLYTRHGPAVFDGQGSGPYGRDYEGGSGGGDVFLFNAGYGRLEVNEYTSGRYFPNALRFGPGIIPDQVAVSGTSSGSGDAVLAIGSGGDQVTLDGQMNGLGVQQVQFADGTVWSGEQVRLMATTGTWGDDSLYGGTAADVFDGKGGHDLEVGSGGGDVFLFNAGYGQLEIREDDGTGQLGNLLRLGAGILMSQVAVSADRAGNVVLTIGTAGDQVIIDGMLDASGRQGVQSVLFADGTSWTAAQVLALLPTTGTPGNDVLFGTPGANTFDGLGGNDYEEGRGGGDTFVFNAGYGRLEVNDVAYPDLTNTLRFGSGVLPSDVTVRGDGRNVVLTVSTGGQVVIDDMQSTYGMGVQAVQFADGTSWSSDQVLAMVTTGTPGDDVLVGNWNAETFDGHGGNDLAVGNGGGDTFVFQAGYGQLKIFEFDPGPDPNNVLSFGAGITASQLAVRSDGLGQLYVTDGTPGDQIRIEGQYVGTPYGVQSVKFADGSSLTATQLLALSMIGTSGADTTYGTFGADLIDGKGAPAGSQDYATGFGGGDTFVFNQGYGRLRVYEFDAGPNPNNVLRFGPGITASQLSVSSDAGGTLYVTDGTPGDLVQIDGERVASYGVQSVRFADGTSLSPARLVALSMTGTSDGDNVYGTDGSDVIDGRGAPAGSQDYLVGNGGSDTFVFGQGYGTLVIENSTPGGVSALGQLDLGQGLTEQSVWLWRAGDDLIVNRLGSSDLIDVSGWFGGNPSAQVAAIKGADGLQASASDVGHLVTAMATYQAANPTFDPASAAGMPGDPSLQSAIQAYWHA